MASSAVEMAAVVVTFLVFTGVFTDVCFLKHYQFPIEFQSSPYFTMSFYVTIGHSMALRYSFDLYKRDISNRLHPRAPTLFSHCQISSIGLEETLGSLCMSTDRRAITSEASPVFS